MALKDLWEQQRARRLEELANLQNLWEQQRARRLEETADRQLQVIQWKQQTQIELRSVKQELQVQAKQLHQELREFATKLHETGKQERQQRRQEIARREQEVLKLRQTVAQRQQQYRAELSVSAQSLFENLQHFRITLREMVWGESAQGCVRSSTASRKAHLEVASEVTSNQLPVVTDWVVSNPRDNQQLVTEEDQKEFFLKPAAIKTRVYQYVQQTGRTGLVEIEQKMGLSRTQTINILRALIQEGLLEQRDRNYFAR